MKKVYEEFKELNKTINNKDNNLNKNL